MYEGTLFRVSNCTIGNIGICISAHEKQVLSQKEGSLIIKKKLTIILQKISAPESDKDIPVFKGGNYYDVPIYDTK